MMTPIFNIEWNHQALRMIITSFVLSLVLVNSGCVAVLKEPVKLDSPHPQTGVSECSDTLDAGDHCLALVRADQFFSSTNMDVKVGQRYHITVPKDQFWYDADRRYIPPKGDAGSFIMNLFKFLKRDKVDWFTLMATVTDEDMMHELTTDEHYDLTKSDIEIKQDGLLVMYPNDANMDHFYKNNSGQIWVCIERLPDVVK